MLPNENKMINILLDFRSLGHTSPCINAFGVGQVAAYKMFETIDRKLDIDVYDTNGLVLEDTEGDVELKDVHFKYPSRMEPFLWVIHSNLIHGQSVVLTSEFMEKVKDICHRQVYL